MRNWFPVLLFTIGFFIHCQAASMDADTLNLYPFDTASEQQRFQKLSQELRCLVCQNQSLAESNAPLAKDLRFEIYKMVKAGKSNHQIANYLAARYGDFVLFHPRLNKMTILIWCGPFIGLAVVLTGFLWWLSKRRRNKLRKRTFSDKDRERIRHLLSQY